MKARGWSNMLIAGLVVCATAARAAPFAYVVNADGIFSIIDTTTNNIVGSIPILEPVQIGGADIAVNPTGTRAYVSDFASGTLTVVDTNTSTVAQTISGLVRPNQVAVAPAGDRIYVTHNDIPGFVSVLDAATYRIMARVSVGLLPYGIVVSPDGTRVYVANTFDNSEANPCHIFPSTCILTVSVIDTERSLETARIAVGAHLRDVALNATGTRAYAGVLPPLGRKNAISVIDLVRLGDPTVVTNVELEGSAQKLAVSPSGSVVYAIGSDSLSIVDAATNSLSATVPLGYALTDLAVLPGGARLYITRADFYEENRGLDGLLVIDAATHALMVTVDIGRRPAAVAIGPEIIDATPTPTAPRPCAGDCDGDGSVSVEELVLAVTIALGTAPVQECSRVGTDGNERVTVDELAAAVNSALTLCPAAVSATESPTPTETPLGIATATAEPCTPDCTPGQRCRTNFPELPEGRCEPATICTSPGHCSRVCLCIPHPDNTCGDACTPGGGCRGLFNGQLFDGVCTETCGCSVEGTPSP